MSLQLDMHKLNKDFISKTKETRLYHCEMPILALTGGIATGKSSAVKVLKSLGVPIIDADKLVKNIYAKEESHHFLANISSSLIESTSGNIDFPKLRKLFFDDSKIKVKIEDFIYAQMPHEFGLAYLDLSFHQYDFLVYDIPLLFEKQLQNYFDFNVLIYSSQNIQRERLIKRDNISEDLANKILHQQLDIEKKYHMADFIIKNDSNIENLTHEVSFFIKNITKTA